MKKILFLVFFWVFSIIIFVYNYQSSGFQGVNNNNNNNLNTISPALPSNNNLEIKDQENNQISSKNTETILSKASSTKPVSATTSTVNIKKTSQTATNIKTQTSNEATSVVVNKNVDFSLVNEQVRKSLVNIMCSVSSSGTISPITGSGVFVSNDGVILTNAHIAQYFLLKDFNGQKDYLDCVIRTGSPAYPTYKAKLVYISPDWIFNNKKLLLEEKPLGTGEYDYAFLKITERVDKSDLKAVDFISLNTDDSNLKKGNPTILVSYPAGFLGGIEILQSLYQSSAETFIKDVFTFKENTIDLISVSGTVISQKGSSGGAVVDSKSNLLGIISVSSDDFFTKDRDLRAITVAYINRDLEAKTKTNIRNLILNADSVSNVFEISLFSLLKKTLEDSILGKN